MSIEAIAEPTLVPPLTVGGTGQRTGARLPRIGLGLIIVGSFTTSSALAWQPAEASTSVVTLQSATQIARPSTPAVRIGRLKERSGLTWGQVADLFGVSRRAVHFWVEGGNMAAHNVARLQRLEMGLADIAGATTRDVRNGLFTVDESGQTPYARLINEVSPSGPRLLTNTPPGTSKPPLVIGPTVAVATTDVVSSRQDQR